MGTGSFSVLAIFVLLFPARPGVVFSQRADIILMSGKIFTADSSQPYAEALAIRRNRILAVGDNAEIDKLASPKTKKIDLRSRTVVPGFNNAHDHLGWPSVSQMGLNFTYTAMDPAGLDRGAVLDSVSRLTKTAKPGQWIYGWIGTKVLYDPGMRAALDSLAPDNPVALLAWWGHGTVVNGKALEVSGLSDENDDPLGGWYERDPATGKITALQENAQVPLWIALSDSDDKAQLKGLRAYSRQQLRSGITTVQQMGGTFSAEQNLRFLRAADLSQRIRIIAWPRSTPSGRGLAEWDISGRPPTPLCYVSGIKYLIDGTPLEQNALSKKPYAGQTHGRLNYPIDTVGQILKEALATDRQLMMHITGDSTLAVVLSLMKQLAGPERWRSKRVRIEHNSSAYITAAEEKDVMDMGLLMMHTPKYSQASPLRSFLEKGIIVGVAPDGTTNTFWEIMVMTSQQADPAENITREQAVIAYTRTNAFAEFAEKEKGTLARGMLADLAVLSQDIFTIPAEQLPATTSLLTMVDGKIVYGQAETLGEP